MENTVYVIPVRNEVTVTRIPNMQPTGVLQQFSAVYPIPGRKRRIAKTRMSSWTSRPALEGLSATEARNIAPYRCGMYELYPEFEDSSREAHFPSVDVDAAADMAATFDCLALFQHHNCLATPKHKQTTYNFKSRRRTFTSVFDIFCKVLHLRSTVR